MQNRKKTSTYTLPAMYIQQFELVEEGNRTIASFAASLPVSMLSLSDILTRPGTEVKRDGRAGKHLKLIVTFFPKPRTGRPKILTKEQAIRNKKMYNQRWTAAHLKAYTFRFNLDTDKEIIDKLDSIPNKSDYVRQLILKDFEG